MRPFDFPLLADENVHPEVVAALRARGVDVLTVRDAERVGANDEAVLALVSATQRVVITHDSDFGRLAVAADVSFIGIIYLRPGHPRPEFVIESILVAIAAVGDVVPPFLITIERQTNGVRIRLRAAPFG